MFSLAIHLIRIPKKWLRRLWLRSITLMVATLRCMFVATLPGATSASASRFDQRRSWSRTESRHRRRMCPVRAAGAAGSAEPLRGLPPRLPPLLALRVYFLHGKASGRRQRAQRRSDAVACSNILLVGRIGPPACCWICICIKNGVHIKSFWNPDWDWVVFLVAGSYPRP
jgi:hypothetical protein